MTGADGDHVRPLHGTILASVSDELDAADISFQGCQGPRKSTKKNIAMHFPEPHTPVSDHDKRHFQGILPDLVLDCSLPPGQLSNSLDGYRHIGELMTLSQRNFSVEERERAERIQWDLE
jgi:hypothetical protein